MYPAYTHAAGESERVPMPYIPAERGTYQARQRVEIIEGGPLVSEPYYDLVVFWDVSPSKSYSDGPEIRPVTVGDINNDYYRNQAKPLFGKVTTLLPIGAEVVR